MKKAAEEIDRFLASGKPCEAPMTREDWISFRDGFLIIAALPDDEQAERDLDTDLHHATDSYEVPEAICPSFWAAVGAMQIRDKRRKQGR